MVENVKILNLKSWYVKFTPEGIVMLTLFKFVSCMPTGQRTLFRLVTRPLSGSLLFVCPPFCLPLFFLLGFDLIDWRGGRFGDSRRKDENISRNYGKILLSQC